MKKEILFKKMACAVITGALLLNVCACTGSVKMSEGTINLMQGISASSVNDDIEPSNEFVEGTANFAVELFKQSADGMKNYMISPLSVMLALSMTANGAEGETLAQMEEVLSGSLDIDELNKNIGAFVANLPNDEKACLSVANSIWLCEGELNVKKEFLETNAGYYNADVYSAKFDEHTINDINNWVSYKTDGTIKQMLDEIPGGAVMYLINALTFDAEWKEIYTEDQIFDGEFNGVSGKQTVSMMSSREDLYLEDDRATGFIKPYAEGYSFVAMMPNDNIDIEDYIASMSGSEFISTIKNAKDGLVNVTVPKFKTEYAIEMSSALKSLGMTNAFDEKKADFSGIDSSSNLFINRVLHKTFINVDERGTKAGAATVVEMRGEVAALIEDVYTVNLDRPFVYAVIDNQTCLPVFMGAVMDV